MLEALILVCSILVSDPVSCDKSNASTVVRVPGSFNNPIACLTRGQEILAETSLILDLAKGEYIKIFCFQKDTTA